MAGDWIKIEVVTPDKPEIDALAELLGASVNEVLGGLIRLWIWADQQTVDGNAASVTKSAIDRHSGVTGFADALLSPVVGWLSRGENGGFAFPNFNRHNGQTAKNRALTAKRVRECKQRKGNDKVTPRALPREEKRREDIKPPIVPQGTERAFEQFWESVHVKTGRRTAEKAHAVAVKAVAVERKIPPQEAAAYILDRMQAFAKSPRAHPKDISPIHPATWLNQGRYDDDPAAWEGSGTPEPTTTPTKWAN
jgi:hypothetical protein